MSAAQTRYYSKQLDSAIWRFPDNQNGEIKGFNDAGVSTFDGHTLRSMVRESIQNSLDAALNPGEEPVLVEYELFEASPSDIPGMRDLKYAFRQCREFSKKGDKAFSFFNQALKHCERPIPILRVSDYGTTGLRGAETGSLASDWSRLVKQSGSSSKGDLSGGSYGIGKYANFACSAMRTVFFGSVDDTGIESSIGVARLTSFNDRGAITSGIGYYSDSQENNAILQQLSFPSVPPREESEPGTDIFIIDCVKTDHLMRTIEFEALSSFLVSIWKGLLELEIGGKRIDSKNLARIVGELNDEDEDERVIIEHFSLLSSGTEGVHKIILDPDEHQYAYEHGYPKGSATLYLKQGNRTNRCVMMTRSQGMKLFEQKNISGTIQFTGILMIEGEKMNEDFREMEAPSHDKWEPERARNKNQAKQRYRGLRQWIKNEVIEAFSHEAEVQIDAFNVGLYLPSIRDVETTIKNRTPNRQNERSLERKHTKVRKRQLKPKSNSEDREMPSFDDILDKDNSNDAQTKQNLNKKKAQKKNKKKKKGSKATPNPLLDGLTRMHVRARAMSTSKAGVYKIKLVVPQDVPQFALRLQCEGELGASDLGISSAEVLRGDTSLRKINDNCLGFGKCSKGEVVELEITPVFDRYCMFGVDFYAAK